VVQHSRLEGVGKQHGGAKHCVAYHDNGLAAPFFAMDGVCY